jgi:translation initiation factor IF-3
VRFSFLEEGNKVKITLRFRGREMAHQQLVWLNYKKLKLTWLNLVLLNKPKMEGRQMGMLLGPKKKK